jgi:predicted metalloprotease with PDZ domain
MHRRRNAASKCACVVMQPPTHKKVTFVINISPAYRAFINAGALFQVVTVGGVMIFCSVLQKTYTAFDIIMYGNV